MAGVLLTGLKDLLWKVYELEETVRYGGGIEQQDLLEQRLLALMHELREASHNTGAFEDLKVPLNMLKYLDEGGIPDEFTADSFRSSLSDNQASKGKVEAVQKLHSHLLQQLSEQLPEETAQYQSLLEAHVSKAPQSSHATM